VVIGGDGSTFDIGLGSLSGMMERGDDVTYICYDNEGYMNTGMQRSSATSYGAWTSTTPIGPGSLGEARPKKDMPAIAAAHGIPYVATASIAYPQDLMRKVRKALAIAGPKYIQVSSPCCLGWGFDASRTVEVARLGVETGLIALYEREGGQDRIRLSAHLRSLHYRLALPLGPEHRGGAQGGGNQFCLAVGVQSEGRPAFDPSGR